MKATLTEMVPLDWNFVDADPYGSEYRLPNPYKEYYALYESSISHYDLANGLIPLLINMSMRFAEIKKSIWSCVSKKVKTRATPKPIR